MRHGWLLCVGWGLAACRGTGVPAPDALSAPAGANGDIVEIAVTLSAPDLALAETETALAVPLEHALAGLATDERPLHTLVTPGRVETRLPFADRAAAEAALTGVRSALEGAKRELPQAADAPVVTLLGSALPEWVVLTSEVIAPDQLVELAKVVALRLGARPGVGSVRRCPEAGAEVQISVDATRLAARRVELAALVRALRSSDGSRAPVAERLGELVIAEADRVPTRLAEVADVRFAPAATDCQAFGGGGARVAAMVFEGRPDHGSDSPLDAEAVREVARELPAGVHLQLVSETAHSVLVAPPGTTREALDRLAHDVAAGLDLAHALVVRELTPRWEPGTWPPEAFGPSLRIVADDSGIAGAARLPPGLARRDDVGLAVRTLECVLDGAAAARLGVSPEAVREALVARRGGLVVATDGERVVRVVLSANGQGDDSLACDGFSFAGHDGARVPGSAVLRSATSALPRALLRSGGQRYVASPP